MNIEQRFSSGDIQTYCTNPTSRRVDFFLDDFLTVDIQILKDLDVFDFRVGEKLRRQDSFANALYVWVATNPFRDQDKQYSNAVSIPLIPATSSAADLLVAAGHGIRHIYREGYHFKKAGVMALDLVSAFAELANGNLFFDRKAREKQVALMAILDRANSRYGAGTLVYASQGFGDEDWRMLRKMTSPLYTTHWKDVPHIIA